MKFHRESLPPPKAFYTRELQQLGKQRRGWAMAICPFHRDKHPSLSVNMGSGGFYCFACGAKGGDIVDFLMRRDGLDFKTAARSLGAWKDNTASHRNLEKRAQVRLDIIAENVAFEENQLRSRYRADLHEAERHRKLAERCLKEIGTTSASQHAQNWWDVLVAAHALKRWAVAAYSLLAFGNVHDRLTFVLRPCARAELILRALDTGFVRDGAGRIVEVCCE